jgi:hypothetical protein
LCASAPLDQTVVFAAPYQRIYLRPMRNFLLDDFVTVTGVHLLDHRGIVDSSGDRVRVVSQERRISKPHGPVAGQGSNAALQASYVTKRFHAGLLRAGLAPGD